MREVLVLSWSRSPAPKVLFYLPTSVLWKEKHNVNTLRSLLGEYIEWWMQQLYRDVEIYNLSCSIDIDKKSGLTSQENVKTLECAQDCIVFGQWGRQLLLLLWRILNGRGLPNCLTELPLSSACLPASTVETPIHSPMSCVHLLLGLLSYNNIM